MVSMHNSATESPPASILVVDDNLDSLRLLVEMLSDHRYIVRPITDGELALASAQANPPDLILLDIMLPGIDGYTICQRLKADQRTRKVPVIFISALNEPFDKVRAFATGGVDYITKPFDAEELLARVATHVALQRAQQQLQQQNIRLEEEIAERRRAEQALRASQARLAGILDIADDAVIAVNEQQTITLFNQGAERIFGYTAPEMIGQTLDRLLPTHVQDVHRQEIQDFAASPDRARRMGARRQIFGRRRDGTEFPAEASISKLTAADEVVLTVILRDITARQQVENALQTSRTLLRSIIDNAPMQITARDREGRFTLANRLFWELQGQDQPQQVLGRKVDDFYDPQLCEAIYQTDRQVLESGQPLVTEAITPGDGQPHNWLVTTFLFHDHAGIVTGIGSITQDITERKQIEQALERANVALFQRIDELSTLNSIAQLLASVTDIPAALTTVCETITRLFAVDGALICTLNQDHTELTPRARFVRGTAIPDLLGQSIQLLEQSAEARMTARYSRDDQRRLLHALHEQLGALIAQDVRLVALRAHGRMIGVIVLVIEQPGRTFSAAELALAETIAGHVAVAIENARLYERAQADAVDAERERLARDLHDSVVQLIYSLTLFTDAWAAAAAQGTLTDVAGRFRQLGAVSQQALREMRLLIHQLRPPALDEVGLIGALQRRLEMVEQRLGIATRIVAQDDLTVLSKVVEEQLFAVAQEALNNALRHAGAGTVHVSVRLAHGSVILAVQDDGHGFNPAEQTTGMGLVTMRERTAAIDGTLVINTALWQGTTVQISAPVKHDVAEKDSAAPLLSS